MQSDTCKEMKRRTWGGFLVLGLCLALLGSGTLVAQTCDYLPAKSRQYLAPPADVAWPHFVVEFGRDRQQALAAYITEDADGRQTVRGYVSNDGRRWESQQRPWQHKFPPPLNGQNRAIEAISPWDDAFRIAYDVKSLRSTSDGGQHWRDVGEMAFLMSVARLKGEREELESLAKKRLAPTGKDLSWRKLIVEQVVFDPLQRGRIFLLTNKGLYRTDDYGQHWSLLPVGLDMIFEIQSLAIDPANTDRLLVGTTQSVYFSSDGGCRFEQVISERWNDERKDAKAR